MIQVTSIESRVCRRGEEYYLQAPADWAGREVFVLIEDYLEQCSVTEGAEVVDYRLRPYVGRMLEVVLQKKEGEILGQSLSMT